eukprot:gene4333-5132_t
MEKEAFLTVALCMQSGVVLYTMCSEDCRGVKTCEFLFEQQCYITDLSVMKAPDINSVNYSSLRGSHQEGPQGYNLVGVTDDGLLIVWDCGNIRFKSEEHYRKHFEGVPKRSQQIIIQKKKPVPKSSVHTDEQSQSSGQNN